MKKLPTLSDIFVGFFVLLGLIFVKPKELLAYGQRRYWIATNRGWGIAAALATMINIITNGHTLPKLLAATPAAGNGFLAHTATFIAASPIVAAALFGAAMYLYIWPLINLMFIQSALRAWDLVDGSGWWFVWPFWGGRGIKYSWVTYFMTTVAFVAALVFIPAVWLGTAQSVTHAITQSLAHVGKAGALTAGIAKALAIPQVAGGAVGVVFVLLYEVACILALITSAMGCVALALGLIGTSLLMPHADFATQLTVVAGWTFYVAPLLHFVLSYGFNFIATGAKKAKEEVYSAPKEKEDYQKSFGVFVALGIAGLVGAMTSALLSVMGLPQLASLAAGSLFAVLLGIAGGKSAVARQGEDLCGYASILAGLGTYFAYTFAHLPYGQVGGILIGSIAGAAAYNLFAPAAYWGLRDALKLLFMTPAASLLVDMHSITAKKYDALVGTIDKARADLYDTKHNEQPAHRLLTLGTAAAISLVGSVLAAVNLIPGTSPEMYVVRYLAAFAGTIVGYLALGSALRVLGLRALGLTVGAIAAVCVGVAVNSAHLAIAPVELTVALLGLSFLGFGEGMGGLVCGGIAVVALAAATAFNQNLGLLCAVAVAGGFGELVVQYVAPAVLFALTSMLNKFAPNAAASMADTLEGLFKHFFSYVAGFVHAFIVMYTAMDATLGQFCRTVAKKINETWEAAMSAWDRLTGNKH